MADFDYSISDNEVTITSYIGSELSVIFPGIIDGYPVVAIGSDTFNNDPGHLIEDIIIVSSIRSIGDRAFQGCIALLSITFLESVVPTVGINWINGVNVGVLGHALSRSNFPARGEIFNGLVMGETTTIYSSPWVIEHQTGEVLPSTYTYTTKLSNTISYMGGACATVGNNVYFSYITHTEISETNPQTGLSESCLSFKANLLKKENGSWSEEIIYTYPPLFSENYSTIYTNYYSALNNNASGYPFNLTLESDDTSQHESFWVAMTASTMNNIIIVFPTWSKNELSGTGDLLVAKYNGISWNIEDIKLNDIDTDFSAAPIAKMVLPDSVIYGNDGEVWIVYRKANLFYLNFPLHYYYSYLLYTTMESIRFKDNHWEFMGEISRTYSTWRNPMNGDRTTLFLTPERILETIINKDMFYRMDRDGYEQATVKLVKNKIW